MARAKRAAALVVLWLAASTARAEEPVTLSGRVVDPGAKKQGVAGATVWAVTGTAEAPEAHAETTADAEGRFTLEKLPPRGNVERPAAVLIPPQPGYDLVARAPDGRLAWISRVQIAQQNRGRLELPLAEHEDSQGILVDENDRPIRDAEVVPVMLMHGIGLGQGVSTVVVPPALAARIRVKTAADGSFRLPAMPKVSFLYCRFEAGGFLHDLVGWTPSKPVRIKLDRRSGTITGRLKLPDQRRLEGASFVTLRRLGETSPGQTRTIVIAITRRVKVEPDGSYRLEGLPPGRYSLHLEIDPDLPFAAKTDGFSMSTLEPGGTATFPEITLEPAVTITGRVVDAETGRGIPGVSINGYVIQPQGGGSSNLGNGRIRTDAEGRFRVKSAKGQVNLSVSQVPRPYVGPSNQGGARVEVKGDHTWPDIALSKGRSLDGVVVDAQGKPMAGVDLYLTGAVGRPQNFPQFLKVGSDGSFHLDQLPAAGSIAIRALAREEGAASNGAIVLRMQDQKGKLTIAVDPKFAFRMRGTIADRSGKPVPDAQVRVQWLQKLPSDDSRQSGSMGRSAETLTAGADGRFETGPLFPGDEYTLSVNAEGYAPFLTPQILGKPGLARGLGTIRLAGTRGYIEGRVLDSTGKPVAGAEVFNRGNGLLPVRTTTDAQGHFRLEKLFSGHKYAFVRKDGHRFTDALVESDRDDVEIRLLRSDEPLPPWAPVPVPSDDTLRAMARRILTRLWELDPGPRGAQGADRLRSSLVLPMAKIDPALALDWTGRLGSPFEPNVRLAGAEVLAEYDVKAAIEVLRNMATRSMALEKLVELATWYADHDASRALAFAEEAAAQIGPLDRLEQTRAKARLGRLLILLGRKDEGTKLVEEALQAIEAADPKAPVPLNSPDVLFSTARAAALVDLKRAQALAARLQQAYGRRQLNVLIATAVATTDPEQALTLIRTWKDLQPEECNALIEMAYRCGETSPETALKIIDAMKGNLSPMHRAEALGWLAVATARHDRRRACSLIDRAFDAIAGQGERQFIPQRSGEASDVTAARVALCARRVGYPDMESVLARVLAARPANANFAMRYVGRTSSVEALVALLDPATAREMLVQAEESKGSLPMRNEPDDPHTEVINRRGDPNPEGELVAWILADGKQAEPRIDDVLKEVERAQNDVSPGYLLMRVAQVLAASPSRREEMLWGQSYEVWYPGRRPNGD
jgi:protocatechuate 3,4-dioxygenase beta subunit